MHNIYPIYMVYICVHGLMYKLGGCSFHVNNFLMLMSFFSYVVVNASVLSVYCDEF